MNYGVIRRIFCRFNQRPIIYDDKSYSYRSYRSSLYVGVLFPEVYIVFKLRYDPGYRVNSQSKLFKVCPCLSSKLKLIYTYILIRCLSTRNASMEFLTRRKQTLFLLSNIKYT